LPSGVIEEPLYTDQMNALGVEWKRLDAALITIEPALLAIPDVFPRIPGTVLRRVKLQGFPGVPPVSIYFAVRGENVHLVAAELIFYDEEVLEI
jgi:hypothetical protein